MNIEKITCYGLICVLIITDIVLFYRNGNLCTEINIKDRAISDLSRSVQRAEVTELNLKANYIYGQTDISSTRLTDCSGITCTLADIIHEPCLILRYNPYDCGECISFAFNKLLKIKNSDIPVVVISSYADSAEMKKFSPNVNSIGAPIYNATGKIDSVKIDAPYYCIVDENCRICDIFIPQKEAASSTDDFLSAVMSRF